MCKFEQIILNRSLGQGYNLQYVSDVERCYKKYFKFLHDDFSKEYYSDINLLIEQCFPYFWVILDNINNRFMGFVYLDNFTGYGKYFYSAELTTCFEKYAWGSFTKYCAKIFLKKCFDYFGFYKIKIQIYPDNFRVKTLLKACGFIYESTLKQDTLRLGRPQDIEVYSLYRSYYYKTR